MRLRCLLVAALASCAVAPPDLYPEAARSARDGRLLRALALLEQIPSAHPRRPECERLWRDVEARIRSAHVQVAEALARHAEGDLLAAQDLLAAAHADWPEAPGLSEAAAWVAGPVVMPAMPAMPASEPAPSVAQVVPTEFEPVPVPVDVFPDVPAPPEVLPESLPMAPAIATSVDDLPAPTQRATRAARATDEGPDLAMLRSLAQGRDLPTAIERLDAEQRRHPEHVEIIELLTNLLRRRALVAYGRGWLEAAIEDWDRIVQINPGDRDASGNLTTARAELARRSASRAGR